MEHEPKELGENFDYYGPGHSADEMLWYSTKLTAYNGSMEEQVDASHNRMCSKSMVADEHFRRNLKGGLHC